MLKRTFISLLAVLLIVAATTSIFAFDFPSNDVSVSSAAALEITFRSGFTNTTESIAQVSLFESGSSSRLGIGFLNNGNTISSTSAKMQYFHVTFTINSTCDIYILSPVSTVEVDATGGSLGCPGFYSDWDSSSTIPYNESTDGNLTKSVYMVDVGTNRYGSASQNTTWEKLSCYFLKFNDVEAGTYTYYYPSSAFSFDTKSVTYNGSSYHTLFTVIPFGFYLTEVEAPPSGGGDSGSDSSDDSSSAGGGSSSSGSGGGSGSGSGGVDQTLLDSWIDPNASFSENVSNIQSTLNSAVAGSDDPDVQTFYAIYANYQLSLLNKSNDVNFSNTVSNINNSFSQVYDGYVSGNLTYSQALDNLSNDYVSSLSSVQSPEQGSYLTAVYQAKQTQLHYKAVQLAGEVIKDAITDEEMDRANQYYEAEEELIAKYEIQKLQDTVDLGEWINLLSNSESITYRTIFNWFLNDSAFKFWLVLPLTLTVVSILLHTRMYNGRSERPSRDDFKSNG